MFERFTEEARRAVVLAQDEARTLQAQRVEPVHLLLALAADPGRGGTVLQAAGADHASARAALAAAGGELDADALSAVGIDLAQVRSATEAAFGPGALDRGRRDVRGHMPFAEGSKRALEESLRYVLQSKAPRRQRAIDSGAVLAGLLAVGDPGVERLLRRLGADAERLREQLADAPAA